MRYRPLSVETLRRLSAAQRGLLILHADAPLEMSQEIRHLLISRRVLIRAKLLYAVGVGRGNGRSPRKTALTREGRDALRVILATSAPE